MEIVAALIDLYGEILADLKKDLEKKVGPHTSEYFVKEETHQIIIVLMNRYSEILKKIDADVTKFLGKDAGKDLIKKISKKLYDDFIEKVEEWHKSGQLKGITGLKEIGFGIGQEENMIVIWKCPFAVANTESILCDICKKTASIMLDIPNKEIEEISSISKGSESCKLVIGGTKAELLDKKAETIAVSDVALEKVPEAPEIDDSSIDMISEDLFGEEGKKAGERYKCKECNSQNVDITEVYLSCENESVDKLFMIMTKIYARCLDCMFPQVVYSHMYEWDPSVVEIYNFTPILKAEIRVHFDKHKYCPKCEAFKGEAPFCPTCGEETNYVKEIYINELDKSFTYDEIFGKIK